MTGLPRRRVLALLGGGAIAGAMPGPVLADAALDVRILQTASSLEVLAEAAWARVPSGELAGVAPAAGRRHAEHTRAFQDRTVALGGRPQAAPNPKFLPLLATEVLGAVTTIETIVADTYSLNLSMLEDRRARELVAAAMSVAAQQLAVLRVARALLAGGQALQIPFPQAGLARLPAAVGTVAIPDTLHTRRGPELIAEPGSGALG